MKNLKFYIFIFSMVFIFGSIFNSNLFANGIDKKFEAANKYYTSKQFDKAVTEYESILQSHIESPEVYFNLGNAYYRLGKYGKAILNYERAKKLNPGEEDYDLNIKIANYKIVDKIKPIPELFFIEWIKNIYKSVNPETFAVWAIVFSTIGCGLLLMYFFAGSILLRKASFFSSLLSFALVIVFIYLGYLGNDFRNQRNEGIIQATTVYIKGSPDDTSLDLFILHEGTKIKVLDRVQEWTKIKIANGSQGWIKNSTYEMI